MALTTSFKALYFLLVMHSFWCYSCFPEDFPLYIGVVAPFAMIYIFNIIVFVLILLSICSRAATSECIQDALSGLILAVTFGIGWIFGILGTTSLPNTVRLACLYVFTILIGIQGLLTFVLRVLGQPEVLDELKELFHSLTDTVCGAAEDQVESAKEPNVEEQVDAAIDQSDTAFQNELVSVTEEFNETIETVIENRHTADDLGFKESGVPPPVTSQLLEPAIPSSPLMTLPGQQIQPSASQHSHGYYSHLGAAVYHQQASQKKDHDLHSRSQEFFIGERVLARNMRNGPQWLLGTVIGQRGQLSYLVQVADGVVWKRRVDSLRKTIDSPQEEEGDTVPDSKLVSSSPSHQDPCSPLPTMNVPELTLRGQQIQPSASQHSHGYYSHLGAAVYHQQAIASQKKDHDLHSRSQEFFIGERILARNMRNGPQWLLGTVIEQRGKLSYLVQVADGVVWKRRVDSLRKTINSPHEEEEDEVPDVDDSKLVSSSPSHQDPLSPIPTVNVPELVLPGQQIQPIMQTAIVFENPQFDCGEDSADNADS